MKKIIIGMLFCLAAVYTFGQDFCYYVGNEKVCRGISVTKMLVKSDLDITNIENALQNTVAGSLKGIVFLQKGILMVEMENTSKENLLELIRQWHSREDVVFVSPVCVDEYGGEAGGYTNEIIVRLKSTDDYSVLQQYAEAYSITDIKHDASFNEFHYILTLPSNSEKNALDIANELHETGFFEYATPELILFGQLDGGGDNNVYIPDQWDGSFTVYPNPAGDVLYIEIGRQMDNPACELNIYNLHGGKAFQTVTNDNKIEINVSVLQNGIYFLRLYNISSGKQEMKKIVIKH
ncbi:MAG: T9SS type A sorting domain-containing protein [Tannerella sp.]|nr:T9SS type A sorting domain-containing protein [Tannerella sp.]